MNQLLFEGNEIFQKMVETSEEGVWLIDEQGKTIYANSKMADILGYEVTDMMGKTMYDFMTAEDRKLAHENLKRREEGVQEHHDFVFLQKNGRRVWTTIAASPFVDKKGNYVGALGMICDITSRRQTEALLEAQRNIFETLINEGPMELALNQLVLSIEGVIDGVICSVLLLDEEQKRLWKGVAPHLPEEYNVAINGAQIGPKAGSCGTSAFLKKVVIVSDTESDPLWEDYRDLARRYNLKACWSSPILAENGDVLGTFALYFKEVRIPTKADLQIVKDATSAAAVAISYVNTREKEKLNKQRSSFLAEARKVLGSSIDINFILKEIPKQAIPMLADFCHVSLIGDEIIPKILMNTIEQSEVKVIQQMAPEELGISSTTQLLSCLAIPLIVRNRTIGAILLASITKNRIYSPSEMELANEFCYSCGIAIDNATLFEQTKQSLSLREEFLSVASHELRTPLTILRGRVDLLSLMMTKFTLPMEIAIKITPTIDSVHHQVNRISKLVDNLLDLSKAGSTKFSLTKEDIQLSSLIREQVANFQSQFKAKNCELVLRLDDSIRGNWDRIRLEQVFSNLITNALKFGPGTSFEIDAFKAGQDVVIKVRDHGIGIPTKDQKRIFGRFGRAVSGKYFAGLGLGLYITTRIIESHGGTIQVESEENKGACFIIELPLNYSSTSE